MVVFIIKKPIDLDLVKTRSIQSDEKERVRQISSQWRSLLRHYIP